MFEGSQIPFNRDGEWHRDQYLDHRQEFTPSISSKIFLISQDTKRVILKTSFDRFHQIIYAIHTDRLYCFNIYINEFDRLNKAVRTSIENKSFDLADYNRYWQNLNPKSHQNDPFLGLVPPIKLLLLYLHLLQIHHFVYESFLRLKILLFLEFRVLLDVDNYHHIYSLFYMNHIFQNFGKPMTDKKQKEQK